MMQLFEISYLLNVPDVIAQSFLILCSLKRQQVRVC